MTQNPENRGARQRSSRPGNPKYKSQPNAAKHPHASGNWQRKYEQYRDLAQQLGDVDRITRENYWQHAEHFFRLINGAKTQQP